MKLTLLFLLLVINYQSNCIDNSCLVKEKEFLINAKNGRVLKFHLYNSKMRKEQCELKIDIEGSSDDTGDKGMTYKIVDSKNKVVQQGFMSSKSWFNISFKTTKTEKYTFILEDLDTSFKGKLPGNLGKIRINVFNQKDLQELADKILIQEKDFAIISEKTRRLYYNLFNKKMKNKNCKISIKIYHSYDDTGDKGMTYKILDDYSSIVSQGSLS